MGLVQSQNCVNLSILPAEVWAELQTEYFTVQRNSNEEGWPKDGQTGYIEEKGWRIQKAAHSTHCSQYKAGCGPTDSAEMGDSVATKYYKGEGDVWRVFMSNGWCGPIQHGRVHKHACGWRICDPKRRTFWPTRCKTPMEKEAWWAWFDEQLESLPIMPSGKPRLPTIELPAPRVSSV